ncbi:hypothetical protein GCM10008018_69700 [Paenibacillus marchantiophytorum]|uniref:Uncharacterized protein n=1 Tax=Paenibacillus marchantiophytorum TaxID=1619310 RepID=A0ABQ1FJ35_9BACL|nr:hypothetical protein GCM10008018_69700 [Paenibacillus marchantiophytorum]
MSPTCEGFVTLLVILYTGFWVAVYLILESVYNRNPNWTGFVPRRKIKLETYERGYEHE